MIAIGADHAGLELKEEIVKYLEENNIEYKDFGTFNTDSCDYPLIAEAVCKSIITGKSSKGILICGTGIGICIAANKIKNIRAALCVNELSAERARSHNDANVICMGSKFVSIDEAKKMVNIFLNTNFEGGRHAKRVNQITEIENKN